MVREYVGARYVVKFSDEAWNAETTYEPLTVVQYGESWFTSKKPVPAGLATPPNNKEYWARTGNYNGQVEEYRLVVAQLEKDFTSLGDDVSAFKTEVNQTVAQAKTDLNDTLEAATTELDEKVNTATTTMNDTITQAKTDLNNSLTQAETELDTKLNNATATMNATVKETQDSLATTKTELEKSISDANTALENTKSELDKAVEAANENANKIKTDLDTRVDTLDETVTGIGNRVTTLEGDNTTNKQSIATIQEKDTAQDTSIANNKTATETNAKNIETLKERNLVLLGDDWTKDRDEQLFTKLKENFTNAYNYGATGAKLADVGTQATTAAGEIDADSITDVYIVAGMNDTYADEAPSTDGLITELKKVTSAFTRAKVHYFPNTALGGNGGHNSFYGTACFYAAEAGIIPHANVICLSLQIDKLFYSETDKKLLTTAGYNVMSYYYSLYANGGKLGGKTITWTVLLQGVSSSGAMSTFSETAYVTVNADTGQGWIYIPLSFTYNAETAGQYTITFTLTADSERDKGFVNFAGTRTDTYKNKQLSQIAYTRTLEGGVSIPVTKSDPVISKTTDGSTFASSVTQYAAAQGSESFSAAIKCLLPDPLGINTTQSL